MTFHFDVTTVHNIGMFTPLLEGTQAYAPLCIINDTYVKSGEMERYSSCCHLCFLLMINACRPRDGCLS